MFLARVYVTLKTTVADPQGLTVRGGLHSLGFAEVESVRAGKYMEIRLQAGRPRPGRAPGGGDVPPPPGQPRHRGLPLRAGGDGLARILFRSWSSRSNHERGRSPFDALRTSGLQP